MGLSCTNERMPRPSLSCFLPFLLLLSGEILGSRCDGIGAAGDGMVLRTDPKVKERLRLLRGGDLYGAQPQTEMLVQRNRQQQDDDAQQSKRGSSSSTTFSSSRSSVSFCPAQCSCNITIANQLQVICDTHFEHDFPISTLRKDVEILKIVPRCTKMRGESCLNRRKNRLNIGPNFKYLRLLKVLVITDSEVPNIGTRTLWGLSGLRILNLSRNRLTSLIDKNFDGLYSLKEIYLDSNDIRSMVSAAFRHVAQLEILSLRDNKIDELAPRIFYKLRHLKYLDLSGNRLQRLDGGVLQDTPNLETFSCESCGLFELSVSDAVSLPKLRSLFLANNSFQKQSDIDKTLLKGLQVLDLDRNRLSALESLTSPALVRLSVSRNNISVISRCALCNVSALADFDLSYNRLAKLNVDMLNGQKPSMRALSLAGNWVNLNTLENLLHRFPSLQNLNLAHTGIVNVPGSLLLGNDGLKNLNLSQNLLVDVEPQVFRHLKHLETLDLSSNFLMGLSMQFFQEVEEKTRLRMVFLQVCNLTQLLSLFGLN